MTGNEREPARAKAVYAAIEAADGAFYGLVFAATMIYMVGTGLTPIQLVLVGTVLEASVLVLEVPTGVLADRRSRRLSAIVGYALVGAGFALMGFVPQFWAFLVSSAVWGLGYTFTSGAVEAWIVDEIGQSGAEPVLIRGAKISSLAGVAGTLAGMGLGTIRIDWPIRVGGLAFVMLALVLAVIMPETGFKPTERDRVPFATFRAGLSAVRGSGVLVMLLVVTVLTGGQSESFDRFKEALLIREIGVPSIMDPVVWLGALGMLAAGLSALANHALERVIHRVHRPGFPLAGLTVVVGASTVVLAQATAFPAAATGLVVVWFVRGVAAPVRTVWTNRHIPSRVRATVLSLYGQADALGQVALGPVFGLLADAVGMRTTITAGVVVLIPAVVLYLRTTSHGRSAGPAQRPPAPARTPSA